MRTRASFKGHSIHPGLIPFPLAFLVGAFLFDLAGVALGRPGLWTTGGHLAVAGIVAGLVAAVPGTVDYFASVPPNSTGRQRARKHGILNSSALVLFAIARVVRGDAGVEPEQLLLAVEALGVGLMLFAAWMGGTLVARNQIGVDHRYADAGKWREERVPGGEGEPIKVSVKSLEPNQMMLVHAGSKRIVVGRTEDGYVAFDDRCTHRGASLADGVMICGTVQCPWHGSQFDCATGEVKAGPAEDAIGTYEITVSKSEAVIRDT